MPGAAWPWKNTWSPPPGSSLPLKKWLKPTSYRLAADAYVARWPPRPGYRLFAAQDHRHRVPADQPPDAALELLVAGEERLLLGADRVDVAGAGQARQPDVPLARALQQLEHQESGPVLALLVHDLVERVEPVLGLGLVDVGQLVLELVEVHLGSVDAGRRTPGNGVQRSPVAVRMRRRRRFRLGCGGHHGPSPACLARLPADPARSRNLPSWGTLDVEGGRNHDYAAARPRRG